MLDKRNYYNKVHLGSNPVWLHYIYGFIIRRYTLERAVFDYGKLEITRKWKT
jgi:hypothetical protein